MPEKMRLDKLLRKKNYFPSRNKAKRAIMAGKVYVNQKQIDKAGTRVNVNSDIEVRGDDNPYVGRGGFKLKKALKEFKIDPTGKEVIDVGASTGGFTDCLLQNGAQKVYAIDVGYGQLAWKLRQNEKVEVIERTNFRHLTPEELPVTVPLIVIDVSFISLKLIIPPALNFLKNNGQIVILVKPQFEAGPKRVGDKGLIKDKAVHIDVLEDLSQFFLKKDLQLKNLSYSPITGASSKNIEFLLHLVKNESKNGDQKMNKWNKKIKDIVKTAHQELITNE